MEQNKKDRLHVVLERLKREKEELGQKIDKLESFLYSDESKELAPAMRELMLAQMSLMRAYESIVHTRIKMICNSLRGIETI